MQIVKASQWTRPSIQASSAILETVRTLLREIEAQGDEAIRAASLRFDGFEPELIELAHWREYAIDSALQEHMSLAAKRVEVFAQMQLRMYRDREFKDETGQYGQRVFPIESVGAYIPGGRHPLLSTALMTLIPARVAGVGERLAVSPSNDPAILAAASLAGASRFLHLGGAQAIAALAFGSSLHPAVDMIIGPGNAYVNAAKSMVQSRVKIDTLAGPSEILILADDVARPEWLAEDILAQAEHDPMALSILASPSLALLQRVAEVLDDVRARDQDKCVGLVQLVQCTSYQEMEDFAGEVAAEHLYIFCRQGMVEPSRMRNYGSLFIGPYSAVALGDYCSGPNHTLPTMGHARRQGGLNVGDFLKIVTFQEVTREGFAQLAPTAQAMARAEGLPHHEASLAIRLN